MEVNIKNGKAGFAGASESKNPKLESHGCLLLLQHSGSEEQGLMTGASFCQWLSKRDIDWPDMCWARL